LYIVAYEVANGALPIDIAVPEDTRIGQMGQKRSISIL